MVRQLILFSRVAEASHSFLTRGLQSILVIRDHQDCDITPHTFCCREAAPSLGFSKMLSLFFDRSIAWWSFGLMSTINPVF